MVAAVSARPATEDECATVLAKVLDRVTCFRAFIAFMRVANLQQGSKDCMRCLIKCPPSSKGNQARLFWWTSSTRIISSLALKELAIRNVTLRYPRLYPEPRTKTCSLTRSYTNRACAAILDVAHRRVQWSILAESVHGWMIMLAILE